MCSWEPIIIAILIPCERQPLDHELRRSLDQWANNSLKFYRPFLFDTRRAQGGEFEDPPREETRITQETFGNLEEYMCARILECQNSCWKLWKTVKFGWRSLESSELPRNTSVSLAVQIQTGKSGCESCSWLDARRTWPFPAVGAVFSNSVCSFWHLFANEAASLLKPEIRHPAGSPEVHAILITLNGLVTLFTRVACRYVICHRFGP